MSPPRWQTMFTGVGRTGQAIGVRCYRCGLGYRRDEAAPCSGEVGGPNRGNNFQTEADQGH